MKQQILILLLTAVGINPLLADPAQGPGLGKPIMSEQAARWDTSVFSDGEGLPQGKGSVAEGKKIYRQQCIACHGEQGLGTTADQLAGAQMALTSEYPEKTIGSYWPYATTVFDFIRRSMPMTLPGSLTDNEVYAVTAYLLYLNNLIGKDEVMNATTLPKVKMLNENGFINVYETEEK